MPERAWSGISAGITLRFAIFTATACLALGLASCGKKSSTPDWDLAESSPSAAEEISTRTLHSTPLTTLAAAHAPSADAPSPESSVAGLRFIAYNVENWLTMDRYVNRKALKNSTKPQIEKDAVIKMLVANKPDVIGLCEIGEAKDLAEIQDALKAAGLVLPHSHYTGGADPVRHLALLSRFPIISTAKPAETDFRMNGRTFSINRGILDATVNARSKPYRFIGVHLKSKRPIEEADQEEMRVHEARLLRRHVDALLKTDPQASLVVYGDFNDTRPTRAFKTVTGSYNDPGYLTALPLKDSRGHAWTHHWSLHDIYSRIDFITVSRALRPEVDFRASHIIDAPDWDKASDHRPLIAIFK